MDFATPPVASDFSLELAEVSFFLSGRLVFCEGSGQFFLSLKLVAYSFDCELLFLFSSFPGLCYVSVGFWSARSWLAL